MSFNRARKRVEYDFTRSILDAHVKVICMWLVVAAAVVLGLDAAGYRLRCDVDDIIHSVGLEER